MNTRQVLERLSSGAPMRHRSTATIFQLRNGALMAARCPFESTKIIFKPGAPTAEQINAPDWEVFGTDEQAFADVIVAGSEETDSAPGI